MSGPAPKPPTRVVVSGGPKVEPHLSQVPVPDETPGVSRGVLVWVVIACAIFIVLVVLLAVRLLS